MERIECKIYNDETAYVKNNENSKKSNSIVLQDSDINVLQVVVPNSSADLIGAINKGKTNIIPLFNIESVFNEREQFTLTPFLKLETSFKISASFILGMIMTVIYSYKELHLVSMNHFAFKYKKARKNGGPDFIGWDKNGNAFWLEAKATISENRVSSTRIKKAVNQLGKVKNNNRISFSNNKLVVASSFRKKIQPNSKQISLSIIDPEFKEIPDDYYSVYDLYSRITKEGLSHMELNLDNVIDNFCGNRFTINDTSVIIFINKNLVELSSSKNTKTTFKEKLFDLQNIIIRKYEKIKNEVKKDSVFAYNGIIIAY